MVPPDCEGYFDGRSVAKGPEAFTDLVDTPLLQERYWGNHLSSLLYDLNSRDTIAGQSTRACLSMLTGIDQSGDLAFTRLVF